jgi:hypothetical protein
MKLNDILLVLTFLPFVFSLLTIVLLYIGIFYLRKIHNELAKSNRLANRFDYYNKDVEMTDTEIKAEVQEIKRKMFVEAKRHEACSKKFRQELREIQNECQHNSTHYESDPSGNGGIMECLVCGKEASRL